MSFVRSPLSLALLSACAPVHLAPRSSEEPSTRVWTGTVDAEPDLAVRLPGGTITAVTALGDVTGDDEPDWVVVGETAEGAAVHVLAGPLTGDLVLPGDALVTLAEPGTTTFTDPVVVGLDGGFAVGSPNDGWGGDGRVFVFHGPIDAATTLADANVLNGIDDERAGTSLAAGDLDGDGVEELIVGSPFYRPTSAWQDFDPGRVYAVPWPYASGTLGVRATATWTGTTAYSAPWLASLGASVAVLDDRNGDGLPELAMGAPEWFETFGEGSIAVAWSPHVGAKDDDDVQRIVGGSSVRFGNALAALDADADGRTDLVAHGHGLPTSYACSVLDLEQASLWSDCRDAYYPTWTNWAEDTMALVPVGDVDGDGLEDALLTVQPEVGQVMLKYGPVADGLTPIAAFTDLDAVFPRGDRAVEAGDVDGDGMPDLGVLGRDGADDVWWTWLQPSPAPLAVTEVEVGDLVVTELVADPSGCSDHTAEWVELHNRGARAVDLAGLELRDAAATVGRVSASVVVPPGGYVVLGIGGAAGWCDTTTPPAAFYGSTPQWNNRGPEHVEIGDGARTLDTTASYSSARAGSSWSARVADAAANDLLDGWCTTTPTPGAPNRCE